MGVVKRICPPHKVANQLKVLSHARVGAHAAHEHVVAPDNIADEPDGEDGAYHGFIREHRLAREGGDQVRGNAHAWQNRDIDFRVSEEPEEVLPQERRSSLVREHLIAHHQPAGNEVTGPAHTIHQEKQARA
jgi:hypothetical protein